MNLKTAARRLGVHYQTAYRWVRSGQLVAVKVGSGYEVSEAALSRFQVQRAAVERPPDLTNLRDAPVQHTDPQHVLDTLDRMLHAVTIDASALYQTAVRLIAFGIGDMGVVYMFHDVGGLAPVASEHVDPEHAVIGSTIARFGRVDGSVFSDAVLASAEPIMLPQVSQRDVHRGVRSEFRQYLCNHTCYSAISVPLVADGEVRGVLFAGRDQPGRPYRGDDNSLVGAIALRLSAAWERVARCNAAWELRARLVARARAALERDATGERCRADAHRWLTATAGDVTLGAAVLDLDLRHVAVTKPYAWLLGRDVGVLREMPFERLVRDASTLNDALARVLHGEIDFCHIEVVPDVDDTAPVMLHAAIVRLPDATPRCMVVVAHAVPEAARDGNA